MDNKTIEQINRELNLIYDELEDEMVSSFPEWHKRLKDIPKHRFVKPKKNPNGNDFAYINRIQLDSSTPKVLLYIKGDKQDHINYNLDNALFVRNFASDSLKIDKVFIETLSNSNYQVCYSSNSKVVINLSAWRNSSIDNSILIIIQKYFRRIVKAIQPVGIIFDGSDQILKWYFGDNFVKVPVNFDYKIAEIIQDNPVCKKVLSVSNNVDYKKLFASLSYILTPNIVDNGISHIKIQHFRSHFNTEIILKNNLLVLVGKNDIGKSSLLEALNKFFNEGTDDINWERGDFSNLSQWTIAMEIMVNNKSALKKTIDKFSKSTFLNGDLMKSDNPISRYHYISSSPHYFYFSTNSFIQSIEDKVNIDNNIEVYNKTMEPDTNYSYLLSTLKYQERGAYVYLSPLIKAYCSSNKETKLCIDYFENWDESKKEDFLSSLDEEMDLVLEFAQSYANNLTNEHKSWLKKLQQIFEIGEAFDKDERIPITKRGNGVKRAYVLYYKLAELLTSKRYTTNVIAIDEVELSLHPEKQRQLIEVIKYMIKNIPNVQFILTTHSPVVVKELSDYYESICVLTKKGWSTMVNSIDRFALNYHSLNEINYLAFDEPSIEYHIELYGHLQNILNRNVADMDRWFVANYPEEERYDFVHTQTKRWESRSLPYCVRNEIDHPGSLDDETRNNIQYRNLDYVRKSIELMRRSIFEHILRT